MATDLIIGAPATDNQKTMGALSYVLSVITGIVVLLMAKDDKFLKFHGWQSIVFGLILTIISLIGSIICIGPIISLLGWLYTLYGAYLIYTGKEFEIPVIADLVKKNLM